jgi:hypothetical protein
LGERREDMRLKVGLLLAIGILVVVSSAMATPVGLRDSSPDNFVQLIAEKSRDYGVSINGTSLSRPGNGGNGSFAEGIVEVQLRDSRGTLFDPRIVFSEPRETGAFKKAQLLLGSTLITTLEASSKANDRLVAVPTPEPGTLFLLAGTMAVGFGVLRKRVRK